MKRIVLWVSIISGVIGIDQFTKWLAVTFLKSIREFPLWSNVLHLTYVENRGAAFGMLKDHRWVFLLISSVAILSMLFFLFYFSKRLPLPVGIAATFVIGGGIGNMIDRIAWGYVVDFIDFVCINFAVFNGADSFVCIGAAWLIVYMLFFDRTEKHKEMTKEQKNEMDSK